VKTDEPSGWELIMGSIWHIGIAVPDLEKGQKELGAVFGLRWRPARVRKLTLADAAGRPYEVECHVVFSLGGPFAVEANRLDAFGYPRYAKAGTTPLLPPGSEFAGEPLPGSAL
jgi:hypothetical protein